VVPWAVALAAGVGGALVALHYHQLGLTLSHYDARGHLVVARRIFDSLTPGWQQVGAVWLPLPHLLNAIPVTVDRFYRSGSSAVVMSVIAFAIASGSIAAIVLALTESASAAVAGAAVFALNPNVLYLQSTPMTEPLLLATTTLAIAMMIQCTTARGEPVEPRAHPARPSTGSGRAFHAVGIVFALACLTRYEAWPVTVAALGTAAFARWRQGDSLRDAVRGVARIAIFPAVAIVGFAIFSRVVVGEWFVSGGFFVPENKALGDPVLAAKEIGWGVRTASGPLLVVAGGAGVAVMAAMGLMNRRRATWLIAASLLAMAAIPWTAFVDGHPFRLRYVIPLLAMQAVGAGTLADFLALGTPKRAREGGRIAAAMLLALVVVYELRPLDASAPIVTEAQWDRPNTPVRATVTACLGAAGSGRKIMASMGSLGHYMQEASRSGFAIRDFLHEGNGDIWLAALESPYPFADWVLIEEKAEGGDMLARIARERPTFLEGYERTCEGAGLALYRRGVRGTTTEVTGTNGAHGKP
jgi:hypothetical protein